MEEPAPPEDLDLLSNAFGFAVLDQCMFTDSKDCCSQSPPVRAWKISQQKEEGIPIRFLVFCFVFVPGHSFDRIGA